MAYNPSLLESIDRLEQRSVIHKNFFRKPYTMSLLLGSDLATVSVENNMYLYYQVSEGHVVEVSSSDGKSWSQLSTIANDITPNSSAFTAFACVKDATNGNKPSVRTSSCG